MNSRVNLTSLMMAAAALGDGVWQRGLSARPSGPRPQGPLTDAQVAARTAHRAACRKGKRKGKRGGGRSDGC